MQDKSQTHSKEGKMKYHPERKSFEFFNENTEIIRLCF